MEGSNKTSRQPLAARESVDCPIGTGVWVKLAVPSCTKKWSPGRVTGIQSAHVICVDGMPRHVRDVRKRLQQGGAADVESLSAELPDGDECEFYDCSDTVQESQGPNTAEAENIGNPLGGPGPPKVPEGYVPHQAADEGARPPEQAEPEVAPVRCSTRVCCQHGRISDYIP